MLKWLLNKMRPNDEQSVSSLQTTSQNDLSSKKYDVFISYNRQDKDEVLPIAEYLQKIGLQVFVDVSDLHPGKRWIGRVQDALLDTRCCAVFCGRFGLGRVQSLEVDVAIDELSKNKDYLVLPVVLPSAAVPSGFLATVTWFPLADAADQKAWQRLAEHILQERVYQDSGPNKPANVLDNYKKSRLQTADRYKHLQELFAPLRVEMPLEEGGGLQKKALTFNSLEELMNATDDKAILLLGDPGGGKSTLLQHYEKYLHQSQEKNVLIPVYIELNLYPSDQEKTLIDWLEERWKVLTTRANQSLQSLLDQEKVCLLLDGLNEMPYKISSPAERFEFVRKFIYDLKPGNRVLVACRTLDVLGTLDAPEAYVQPLEPSAIKKYLDDVCVSKGFDEDIAHKVKEALEVQGVLELYQNPYRLHLLASCIDGQEVPSNRAELFSYALFQSIKRQEKVSTHWNKISSVLCEEDEHWIRKKKRLIAPQIEQPDTLLYALGEVAFSMQQNHPGTWGRLTEKAFQDIVGDSFKSILEVAIGLDLLVSGTGDDGYTQTWRFVHQQYQEYFAARAWVRKYKEQGFAFAYRPYLMDDPKLTPTLEHWFKPTEDRPQGGVAPGQALPERPASHWEETATIALNLAGIDMGFAQGLMAQDPVQVARTLLSASCSIEASQVEETKKPLRETLLRWLKDPKVELRARVDAGLALDEEALTGLGYQKCYSVENVKYWMPPKITIPAGEYPMGSGEEDKQAFDNEKPGFIWTLDKELVFAKYPVTRAEYACFIDAGGYDDMKYWPEETEARAWRKGTRPQEEVKQRVQMVRQFSAEQVESLALQYGWSDENKASLILLIEMSEEEAISLLTSGEHPGLAGQPYFWADSRFTSPLQPVVGISWFEAQAYVQWLSNMSGRLVRLSDENEWEAAARGKNGRIWASGDKFDARHTNSLETGLRKPSPIHAFFDDVTEQGGYDFIGNIREWTHSEYNSERSLNRPTDRSLYVNRGGSWNDPWNFAHEVLIGTAILVTFSITIWVCG